MSEPLIQSLLSTLQDLCVQRLEKFAYFTGIPVIHERHHDIDSALATALGKIGACVVILTPEASVENHRDCPFPFWESIKIVAQVIEHPTINRKLRPDKTASEIAEQVAMRLHFFNPPGLNIITLDNPSISLVPSDDFLVYQVRFSTSAGVKPDN